MRLSIVIPACNEERRIGSMLDAYAPHFVARYGVDVELVVVVNGSTDGTEALVRAFGARWPAVRCIVEPARIGKGGALIRGFQEARGEAVGFVDADGATPPEAFEDLVKHLEGDGAVIASRWRRESRISPRQSIDRRIASRIFNLLVRLAFGLRLTDTQCGAKVMSGKALRTVLPHLGITQWAFDVDLLFQLRRAGYRITEIPTTWHDVAGSKVEVVRASFEMVAGLARLRLLYSPLRWMVGLYERYLSPFIHPPGMEQDRLFRHSLIVLTGAHTGGVFNLVFQVAMAALMVNAEYGVLSAMLSVLILLGTLAGALSRGVTHFSAIYAREGQLAQVAGLIRRLTGHLLLITAPLLALLVLLRHDAAAFFRLDSPAAVLLAALALAIIVCTAPLGGALSGLQAFIWGSAAGVLGSALRLASALALVWAGWQAMGGLAGHILGAVAAAVLSVCALKHLLPGGRAEPVPVRAVYAYSLRYLTASIGFAMLSNVDVPLVKHYFVPDDAGLFAKAATVARMVIFLPLPLASTLFPKVVSAGRTKAEHLRILAKGMALVLLMVGAVALVCMVLPGPLLTLFRSGRLGEAVPVMRGMTLALLPLSLVYLLMQFEFAQRRFAIGAPLLLCAAGYVAGVAFWHPTVMSVVAWLGAAGWTALLLSALCVAYNTGRKPAGVMTPGSAGSSGFDTTRIRRGP